MQKKIRGKISAEKQMRVESPRSLQSLRQNISFHSFLSARKKALGPNDETAVWPERAFLGDACYYIPMAGSRQMPPLSSVPQGESPPARAPSSQHARKASALSRLSVYSQLPEFFL
jgi:hypothetical protein